jgi:hypothetical protein
MEFIKETADWKVLKADWRDRVSIMHANIEKEQVVEAAESGGGREADV